MVKLQYDEHNNRYHITISSDLIELLGWDEKLEEEGEVKINESVTPDGEGFIARVI